MSQQLRTKLSVFNIVLCGLFAALMVVGATFKVPSPLVDFSLQMTFAIFTGLVLGPKLGAISTTVYMAMGLIGLPVFTQGGGPGYILKPSFGFIIGFILAAFLAGLIAHRVPKPSYKRMALAGVAGFAATYVVGLIYCYCILVFYMGKQMELGYFFINFFLIFIPGDVVSTVIAIILAKRLLPVLKKFK
jgi:biotin transport system substrate-specific component